MHSLASNSCHLFHIVVCTIRHSCACNLSLSLLSCRGVGQVSQSLLALEFSILDDPCLYMSAMMFPNSIGSRGSFIPASASEEKCADHCTKVDPSLGPVVTAWHLMVEMRLEYVRAGVEEITE